MGNTLLQTICQLSGLSEYEFKTEFNDLFEETGFDANSLTLDQFRTILTLYLEKTLPEIESNHELLTLQ